MASVYSVGQVNTYIKNMFTQDFLLSRVSVKGEVSNCKYHSSGHIYFTLKDGAGTLAAVMFAGNRNGLAFRMEDGMKVIVTGSVSVYERDGKYQLYANKIVLDGEGDLFRKYQELKAELEEMGMFAPEYKKPIPRFARTVGIVTAGTGAAIRDIMNISARRNPFVQLVLYSAIVQGEYASGSIVKGIEYLDEYGVDVIIVGRGGGSIEDLWAFNEEAVARAIFNCNTPVISAVGHETDYTIADFVSDLRAPTPSAAAELAVFDYMAFENQLDLKADRVKQLMINKVKNYRDVLSEYMVHFKYLNPVYVLNEKRQLTADLESSLIKAMSGVINTKRQKLAILAGKLDGVSPLKRIEAGYAYIEDNAGDSVKSVCQVAPGDKLKINLKDGIITTCVENIDKRDLIGGNNG